MAVREILKFGNETLRKTCHPVQKFDLRLRLLLRMNLLRLILLQMSLLLLRRRMLSLKVPVLQP